MRNMLPNREFIRRRKRDGRIGMGVLIAALGVVLLLRVLNLMPGLRDVLHHGWAWAFVAAGVFSIIFSRFRNPAGYIFLLIGAAHVIGRFEVVNGVYSDRLIWPVAIIALGLVLIFRRRRPNPPPGMKDAGGFVTVSDSTRLNIDVFCGGRKEVITSKAFQGGRVKSNFSGVELNLMQAAAAPGIPMELELRLFCAGCEIVVPAHWEVRNEIAPIFGAIEDNRGYQTTGEFPGGERPVLLLKGTCICGGIDIKAY